VQQEHWEGEQPQGHMYSHSDKEIWQAQCASARPQLGACTGHTAPVLQPCASASERTRLPPATRQLQRQGVFRPSLLGPVGYQWTNLFDSKGGMHSLLMIVCIASM
jgi:hypothetical protein